MRDEFEDIPEVEDDLPEADEWAGSVAENHESDHDMLARLTSEFLARGGQVQSIAYGATSEDNSQLAVLTRFAGHTHRGKEARERMEQALERRYAKSRANDKPDTDKILAALGDPKVTTKKQLCEATGLANYRVQRLLKRHLKDHPRYPWFVTTGMGTRPAEVVEAQKKLLVESIASGAKLDELYRIMHMSRPYLRNFAVSHNIKLPESTCRKPRKEKCEP